MASPLRSLDHFVAIVRNLEMAANVFRRLGFTVMPVMEHVELGSSNTVVQFQGTYLELIGDLDRVCIPSLRQLLTRLDGGEGLLFNSLTSDSLDRDRAGMVAAGLRPDPIISARRRVRMPEGGWDETDSSSLYMWNTQRRFMSLFLSEHRKPQSIWMPGYQQHANGVQRVTGLVYVSADPQADVDYLSAFFGFPPSESSANELRFDTPRKQAFTVLSPSELSRRHGAAMGALHAPFGGHGVGLQLEVDDVARCSRLLLENGVPHELSGNRLRVAPAYAAGIGLELSEAT
ncbi:MAG: VOC family protein [Burkholderiaceae bacterium]